MSSVNPQEIVKESESEHGDKTYLVRTDLAGQVDSRECEISHQNLLKIVQRLPRPMGRLRWRAPLAA